MVILNLDGGGHGQEASEEGEEGGEEEEESSRSKDLGEEVGKAGGRKEEGGPQGSGTQEEGGRPQASCPRDAYGGAAGAGGSPGSRAVDRGHPWSQDRAEPGGGLAVSDGVPALMAPNELRSARDEVAG